MTNILAPFLMPDILNIIERLGSSSLSAEGHSHLYFYCRKVRRKMGRSGWKIIIRQNDILFFKINAK